MPEPTACVRHPRVQTRLRCATCGVPICPQCAVTTPVGMKCPDDARLPRSARGTGTPQQLVRAGLAGLVGAGVGAIALSLFIGVTGGFLSLLASFFAGMLLGDGVKRAAQGNGGTRFRTVAIVAACAMVGGVWLMAGAIPRGLGIIMVPAAGYGASTRFPWA